MKRFIQIGIRCLIPLMLILFVSVASVMSSSDVAATVNGQPIYEKDIDQRLKSSSMAHYMFTAGPEADVSNEKRSGILADLIRETIILQQADKQGIELSGSDEKEVAAQADEVLAGIRQYVAEYDPTLSESELQQLQLDFLARIGLSEEIIEASIRQARLIRKVEDDVRLECCSVDEDDVSARYQELLEDQRQRYADDPVSLERDLLEGNVVVHRPYDSKVIFKVEFVFDSTLTQIIRNLRAVGDEATIKQIEAEQLRRLKDEAHAMYEALTESDDTLDQKLDTLLPDVPRRLNYYTKDSSRFNDDYREHANKLTVTGDVSEPFSVRNGFAILILVDVLPETDQVEMNDVSETLAQQLLDGQRDEHMAKTINAWIEEAEITYFLNE